MIDMRITRMFLDRKRVMAAVGRARRSVLARAGALIRLTARRSMRRRKGHAPPGRPPYAHEGSLRRLILFGYDRAADSVVVGPVGFRRSVAPNLLEFGGSAVLTRRRRGKVVRRRVRVEARPYMGPALQKQRPKLPRLWRNSVRG